MSGEVRQLALPVPEVTLPSGPGSRRVDLPDAVVAVCPGCGFRLVSPEGRRECPRCRRPLPAEVTV